MIKVLIVDDSKVIQQFLAHILSSDDEIEIVGFACSGSEAIEMAKSKKPDIITMDIHMPGISGFEATRTIMETVPTPLVIVSGSLKTKDEVNLFRSVEAGALALLSRPPAIEHPQFKSSADELIRTVKLMSEVKVIRLFPSRAKGRISSTDQFQNQDINLRRVKIIAIGASTGGPAAIQKILSGLPKNLPVPVLIVQHIAKGFITGFKNWLSLTSGINLKIAEHGELIMAGIGYIAPDNFQMGIDRHRKICLIDEPPENGSKPSVSYLFRSISQTIAHDSISVLLTGMGKDGVNELKLLKDKGAVTIVQSEESSVVFGMPGEAIKIGAAMHTLAPEKIALILAKTGLKN